MIHKNYIILFVGLIIVTILCFAYTSQNKKQIKEGFVESETDFIFGDQEFSIQESETVTPTVSAFVPVGTVMAYQLPNNYEKLPGENLGQSVNRILNGTGWFLCNGFNDTPNLMGKFIIGTDTNEYSHNKTGGSKNTKLTLTIDNLPKHDHEIDFSDVGCRGGSCGVQERRFTARIDTGDSGKNGYRSPRGLPNKTKPNGNGKEINVDVIPPYHSLLWIMYKGVN